MTTARRPRGSSGPSRGPPGYRRDRGVYLARESLAHAHAGDPALAATVGMRALEIAAETGSGRIVAELAALDADLAPAASIREVADFRAALTDVIPQVALRKERT